MSNKFDRRHCGANRDAIHHAVLQSVICESVPSSPLIPLRTGAAVARKDQPKDKSSGLPWHNSSYRIEEMFSMSLRTLTMSAKGGQSKSETLRNTILPDTSIFYLVQICTIEKSKLVILTWIGWTLIQEIDLQLMVWRWLNGECLISMIWLRAHLVTPIDWSSFDSTVLRTRKPCLCVSSL